ncbi:MAG: acetyl-CoA C-acyltransferase [Chloroflexi bacterium]|nr:acetyl-CoA C-acyltransferase [Chloroflexota bacterium]
MRDAVIVAALRTPVGKAKRGGLATVRADEMASIVIKELLNRTPQLDPADIDDVILGCSFPEGEQGMNMARLTAMRAGLPHSVPGETINRFCSSGVQSIAHAAQSIMSGQMEVVVAGGAESMTQVPMTGYKFAPNLAQAQTNPEAFTSMGITSENVAEKYDISREDQDAFAMRSNEKAVKAVTTGVFDAEIVPVEVEITEVGADGKPATRKFTVSRDEGPRAGTTQEGLAKLRTPFKEGGRSTAGNSSQMSDGAAAVIIMSADKAKELGIKPLARYVSYAVGGVAPDVMGIGPVAAIPKALKIAGLEKDDVDLFELNEAFASQSLAVIRELELDEEKINVNGGAIALGHPLGCTGAKLTTQLIYEMGRRGSKYGMVTMCIGGGMGAAAIFENLQ